MRYMLLIHGAENGWTEEERRACVEESMRLCERLAEEGKSLLASPLQPVATAAMVRVRDGKRWISDGPFTEAKEVLVG